ncbi:MarR family winged helix-turn-helix transcriptional regulator [Flavobacterium aquicola]|uniref:DNA-binding MarR family transcriptional regulator n=1 Tax=Flavobacterium aquicola TaxID=1682742 RepID=A0A3E0EJQ7_9FLAO|nr:MarR family transcriptional regulator [Flavobacterium aquicola]REG98472.1 DNA-binding MarR family transcriptional regulator [Flavobacterium aquicola]
MEKLNDIIFYSIEKSIKTYRQFAQKNISKAGIEITIDQWLVLKTIEEDNSISQKDIATKTFKDVASITRIIELLVQKGYLSRNLKSQDRRRFDLTLTKEGNTIIDKMQPYIQINRTQALKNITDEEIKNLHSILSRITANIS